MADLVPLIMIWIQKELGLLFSNLPVYLDFYRLRDRIPFFTLLFYLVSRSTRKKLVWEYLSGYFVTVAGLFGLCSIYLSLTGVKNTFLTGFVWRYSTPIQYSLQIIIISYLTYRGTKEFTYSATLAFHLATVTGYITETPFWFFSSKETSHFIHSNPNNLFLISYQIIAIPVVVWLLSTRNVKMNQKRFSYFIYAYFLTYIMASKMYLLESALYSRIPLIVFSIYLASEIRETDITTQIY